MIRVTFADGYEDREDDSPCIANVFEPVLRHPSEERWYLWFPGATMPFSFCARTVRLLSALRGDGALVWRITSAPSEPLAGRWEECRVESYPEQIARLEWERDAAHQKYVLRDAHALLWKGWARELWEEKREAWRALRSLRDAARNACDREMGKGHRYPESVKVSTLVAHLNTMDFGATEKARADAAEKRLADLRTWADDIVKRSREEAPKHPGKANTTWTILSVLEWVVARIDGKEG